MFPYGYRTCLWDAGDYRPKRKYLGIRNTRRRYKKKERFQLKLELRKERELL